MTPRATSSTVSALVAGSVLVGTCLVAAAQSPAPEAKGTWGTRTPLPHKREEVTFAVAGGKIYALGGQALGRDDSPINQEFDPATGRWRERAAIPRGVSHTGAASLDGKVYVASGFTKNVHLNAIDVAYEYDPVADAWRALPPLSSPRGSVGLAAVAGRIHAVGGRGVDRVTVTTHEAYDPKTGKWSVRAPLPVARDHLVAIAVEDKLHVIGGRTNGQLDVVGLHDVYDPATDTWSAAPPMPTARSGMAGALFKGMIVVLGGECRVVDGKRYTYVDNEAYDPKVGRWVTLARMPDGRHGHGAATIGDTLYVGSGATGCGGDGIDEGLLAFSLP